MSKSIDDYRNIIKILKLQLLKIRQENSSLAHTLGIATQSETSSFTPKIDKYHKSIEPFTKNILAFLNLAHRCEAVGLAPEMIFRIADKKRDKKVSCNSFKQILKRVKLRMSELQIDQLVNLITNENHIFYDKYLQCLSAFQINSQKYPQKTSRTYFQLCLLKFGQEAKKYNDQDKLYKQMNNREDRPYLTFENYANFVKRNLSLEEFEIVAVFVGLDLNSQCKIQKLVFKRQIGKAFQTLEKNIDIQSQLSNLKEPIDIKSQKKVQRQKQKPTLKKEISKKSKPMQQKKQEQNDEFKYQEQTGQQAGNKAKKPAAKPAPAPTKAVSALSKGNYSGILGQFKKLGIKINDFMNTLINNENKTSLVKSFTINDFREAVKLLKQDISKKKILELFKALDTQANGSIDSSQLLKIWLRGKEISDGEDALFRLLFRHLRETQFPQPLQKFKVLGIAQEAPITEQIFTRAFSELDLTDQQIRHIMANYILTNTVVKDFAQRLKSDGKSISSKKFVKMDKKIYEDFKKILQKINAKREKNNFQKLMRLQTGEKSQNQFWETIFTDEWSCWQYCLETAFKLEAFWRDHQFGPTKTDSAGIRSIIGNQSNPPPGLPAQDDISWRTLEEIIAKQQSKEQVIFVDKQLSPNDVVQGKLGDCWYVSSLSIIANNPQYLLGKPVQQCRKSQQLSVYGVNPYLFKYFSNYGIYVFKYYKKFKPIYVLVDDLFPVQTSSNELIFAKSPNLGLQWVAFLEKSYAKLHHTYSNMISGDISQGLNDLTNALPIKESIDQQSDTSKKMQKIKRLNDQQQLMGCSITAPKGAKVQAPVTLDDQKCGLFYGHAYSILQFLALPAKQEFNLMRVRNPWGHGQWILDWSDKPKDKNQQYMSLYKYKQDLKKYYEVKIKQADKYKRPKPIPYKIGEEDGEFLMSFDDFIKVYTNLFTGYRLSDVYKCYTIKQVWDSKFPGGVCSLQKATPQEKKQFVKNNHQYVLDIKQDDTDVLMYVIQEDGRLYRGEKYPYKQLCNGAMILAFSLDGKEKMLEQFNINKSVSKNLKFELRRQVNMWYKFKKGRYAIVPCKMKNEITTSEFQFRIYYDKKIEIQKVNGHNNKFDQLSKAETNTIDESSYKSFLDLVQNYNK